MTEQPETVPVIVALSRVMAEVQSVGKDGKYDAAGTRYIFRGVDAVVNAVGPALRNHGVVVMPIVEEVTYRDAVTSGGKAARGCQVRVRYVVYGPAGDKLDEPVVVVAESLDNSDKGTAKAMSVAYRTLWLQLLCIPTDDPDPDSDNKTLGSARASKPSASRPADPEWLPRMEARIAAAKTKGELQNCWRDSAQGVRDGQIHEGQAIALQQAITKRTEAIGAGAPKPSAQRASAQTGEGWPAVKPVPVNGAPS